jgi:hypothetical protein
MPTSYWIAYAIASVSAGLLLWRIQRWERDEDARNTPITITPSLPQAVAIPTRWRRLRRVEAPTFTTSHEGDAL